MAPSTTTDTTKPILTLHRDGAPGAHYVWSPFVTKLEARMRFGGLASYRTARADLSEAPMGKLPYLRIEENDPATAPQLLGDSTLITRHLVENGLIEDLNARVAPATRAIDLAMRSLLEDRLYFYQSYEKWHENYPQMRDHALEGMPYPLRIVIGLLAYRKSMAALHGQGSGRLGLEERRELQRDGWTALETQLAASATKSAASHSKDEPFWLLGGEAPTDADATLYGFIVASLVNNAAPNGEKLVRSLPTVMDFAGRIHRRYFPDYDLPLESKEN